MIQYFSDRALIAGNYGPTYAMINLIADAISIIGIAIFIASVVYKITAFNTIKSTNHGGWIG